MSPRTKSTVVEVSALDKLVLSQAVWEFGLSWTQVSRTLSKHPLLSHPKSYFTAQSCHAMYDAMMIEAGLELDAMEDPVHAPTHLKLAEKYHVERVQELRTLIEAEEEHFKSISDEIDELRLGTDIPAEVPENESNKFVDETPDEVQPIEVHSATPVEPVEPPPAVALSASEDEPSEPLEILQESDATMKVAQEGPTSPPLAAEVPSSDGFEVSMDISDTEKEEATPEAQSPSPAIMDVEDLVKTEGESPLAPSRSTSKAPEASDVAMPVDVEPETLLELKPESDIEESKDDENPESPDDEVEESAEVETLKADSGSPAGSVTGELPDAEEVESAISTRRSTRGRPSAAATSAATPNVPKKRGRKPMHRPTPSPEPDIEFDVETAAPGTPASLADLDDLPLNRRGKRKASVFGGFDSPRERKRAREESEPVEDDEQPLTPSGFRRRGTGRTEEQVAIKRFQTVIGMVHSQISQHRNGNIFHNPIKRTDAPDYYDIVKRPTDLKSIKAKIKDGGITNSLEFQRDIYLMFANAIMFNRPGSDVHTMAEDMMMESDAQINTFRQTEGFVRSSR